MKPRPMLRLIHNRVHRSSEEVQQAARSDLHATASSHLALHRIDDFDGL